MQLFSKNTQLLLHSNDQEYSTFITIDLKNIILHHSSFYSPYIIIITKYLWSFKSFCCRPAHHQAHHKVNHFKEKRTISTFEIVYFKAARRTTFCRWTSLFIMSRRNFDLFFKVIKKIWRKLGIHSRERSTVKYNICDKIKVRPK